MNKLAVLVFVVLLPAVLGDHVDSGFVPHRLTATEGIHITPSQNDTRVHNMLLFTEVHLHRVCEGLSEGILAFGCSVLRLTPHSFSRASKKVLVGI